MGSSPVPPPSVPAALFTSLLVRNQSVCLHSELRFSTNYH